MSIETTALLGRGAHLKKCHSIQPIELLFDMRADSLVEGFCGLGREEFPAGTFLGNDQVPFGGETHWTKLILRSSWALCLWPKSSISFAFPRPTLFTNVTLAPASATRPSVGEQCIRNENSEYVGCDSYPGM